MYPVGVSLAGVTIPPWGMVTQNAQLRRVTLECHLRPEPACQGWVKRNQISAEPEVQTDVQIVGAGPR